MTWLAGWTLWTLPPDPLTARERRIVVVLSIFTALSRLAAIARSAWDWDEILFCHGVREFDVAPHHPHPPGFPVFIATAKLVNFLLRDEFRSLQSIVVASSILLFPLLFTLARELRFPFTTALAASTLCIFFPNVWFYGGTAFSDVPSLALIVAASAMLLRGCRSFPALCGGAILLGLAAGVRPQNLLIGFVPSLFATWCRARQRWWEPLPAMLLGALIVAGSFGGAMLASSSVESYRISVAHHQHYITAIDSFLASGRPPLSHLFHHFFFMQYQSSVLSVIVSLFVIGGAVGAVRDRSRPMLMALLAFGPFALLAWLMLDRHSISRFSIGYVPLFAILAAEGLIRFSRLIAARRGGSELKVGTILLALLVSSFIVWSWPALTVSRTTVAPPVGAMRWIDRHLDPATILYVDQTLGPFADLYLPARKYLRVIDEHALYLGSDFIRPRWAVSEWRSGHPRGVEMRRPRRRLWKIARRHYFDVSVFPHDRAPRFVEGWQEPEISGENEARWMASRSVMELPPVKPPAWLRMVVTVPEGLPGNGESIELQLNGRPVDRRTLSHGPNAIDLKLPEVHAGAANRLEVTVVDRVVQTPVDTPADTGTELRLRLDRISWGHRARKGE